MQSNFKNIELWSINFMIIIKKLKFFILIFYFYFLSYFESH